MSSNFPGEKLLYPSSYGPEEYLVVALFTFVVFVTVKHIIFHTLYFWWYRHGQFYVPDFCWTVITGKKLPQRLLKYVKKQTQNEDNISLDKLMAIVDEYFKTKEFAPSLSTVKGKVVDDAVSKYQPSEVLVVGCHVGYVVLQVMRSLPQSGRVIIIESNEDFIVSAKRLLNMIGLTEKAIFIHGELNKGTLEKLKNDYNVTKLDFVFFNRTKHDMPSHVPLVKLLEEGFEKNAGFFHTSRDGVGVRTTLLADKVVLLDDPEFLKYVRGSDNYETKYYQMPLEHSCEEIVDGMELATFIG